MQKPSRNQRLGELALLFCKLGIIGFGGPAAHIALMDEEVVQRRKWMSRQHFLDLIGATNLIPGPNSTEMTMHVGFARAGWIGLAVAGISFILPAAILTGILAWAYVRFGTLPEVEPFLVGIKPAVLAIILGALWRLGKKAISSVTLIVLALGVGTALLLGLPEIPALLGGGIAGMMALSVTNRTGNRQGLDSDSSSPPSVKWLLWVLPIGGTAILGGVVSVWKLGLFFLKVGAVLYGSGYVLIAFLQGDLVDTYGWLTQQQLLDAVAIGQLTPGPVLTTATFIGYVLAGVPGAIVATLGIFLPSFVFAGILHPLVPRLRSSKWTAGFLDAINASAVALMAVVTILLGKGTLTTPLSIVIFLLAAALFLRLKINAVWLILGSAFVGAAAALGGLG